VLADISGAQASALIPRIEQAVKGYTFANCRRLSHLAGAEQQHLRRDRAARRCRSRRHDAAERGRARLPSLPYVGLTDSGTGIEASLWGVLGVKLGWVEGVEVNFLGLVAGLDLRNPGVKLPGFGRIGIPVDFILFALTLLGVALFHHHTLQVALTGLAAIVALQADLHRLQVRRRPRRPRPAHAARVGDPRQPVPAADGLRAAVAAFRGEPRPARCRASCRTTGRAASCCW
jgi:hypothetical protein